MSGITRSLSYKDCHKTAWVQESVDYATATPYIALLPCLLFMLYAESIHYPLSSRQIMFRQTMCHSRTSQYLTNHLIVMFTGWVASRLQHLSCITTKTPSVWILIDLLIYSDIVGVRYDTYSSYLSCILIQIAIAPPSCPHVSTTVAYDQLKPAFSYSSRVLPSQNVERLIYQLGARGWRAENNENFEGFEKIKAESLCPLLGQTSCYCDRAMCACTSMILGMKRTSRLCNQEVSLRHIGCQDRIYLGDSQNGFSQQSSTGRYRYDMV